MEISSDRIPELERIAVHYRLKLILLFGSSVTGRRHPRSDMDIAVLHENPALSYRDYSELNHALAEIFPGQEVDLSSLNHADPLFLKKVAENCQILYGETRRLQALKLYAFKRYQDHRRYFEMERAYVERFLKEEGILK
ncbi:MAG: nucleotidyltransferase domain-containing protein [Acidobacteria bacterium]|nr:nucleotidyltransferase domain-containing protein [Acidobacteriota bacterium]MBI3658219.1 nucleotidyltransferase domain-containing protein [Acidobacteriota bacterium]